MNFEYLRFRNYRPYYGEQTIHFHPDSSHSLYRRNIILIGGLNGQGKTSLINAILICLYGQRRFKKDEYAEIIRNAINYRHLREGGNSGSIELAFRDDTGIYAIEVTFIKGKDQETRRLYQLNEELKKVKEITVSEYEFVEFIDQRIPVDVSQFFIFDAEKIRELVGEQDKDETVQAIQKVVSLELYKQLSKDLDHLIKKWTRELKDKSGTEYIEKIQQRLNEIQLELDELEVQLSDVQKTLAVKSEEELELQQERRRLIANSSRTREAIIKAISDYEGIIRNIDEDLKQYKIKDLPKLILAPLIKRLKERLREEREFLEAKEMERRLFTPYETFASRLLSIEVEPPLTEKQKETLKIKGKQIWAELNQIKQRPIQNMQILHDLSRGDYQKLNSYSEKVYSNVQALLEKKHKYEALLKQQQVELQDAPEAIDTQEYDDRIKELNQEIGELKIKRRELNAKIRELRDERTNLFHKLTNEQKKLAELGPIEKKLDLTNRLYQATQEFIDRVTLLKAQQLKREVEVILGQLFRKDEFSRVVFDPNRFTLVMFNQHDEKIDIMSRSEGEKQLISLGMIWALTKVSGSKMPFVIDTPLARLDSVHRKNIVEHYFTHLSDQVIILSTDTEITFDFYKQLKPFINREYILVYDQESQSTRIYNGYFFEQVIAGE